jgi:hypothetical protein
MDSTNIYTEIDTHITRAYNVTQRNRLWGLEPVCSFCCETSCFYSGGKKIIETTKLVQFYFTKFKISNPFLMCLYKEKC